MARRPSTRVVLNRAALTALGLALADGLEEVARTIVETADAPDATPYGEGLVDRGGWLVYQGPNKVGGGSLKGTQPKKPRAYRVRGGTSITAIAGFGFPGRFQETGTVHHAAQPFLTPAGDRVAPTGSAIIRDAVRPHLRRQP